MELNFGFGFGIGVGVVIGIGIKSEIIWHKMIHYSW